MIKFVAGDTHRSSEGERHAEAHNRSCARSMGGRGELERRIDRALGSRLQRPHSAQPPNRVIPPATQRSMAERAGSTITEIAGSHVSLVSHPGAAIDAILAAVAAIGE
jgi:hypothetical protein